MYLEFHPLLPSGLVKILWFYRVPRLWGDVHYPNMGVLSGPPPVALLCLGHGVLGEVGNPSEIPDSGSWEGIGSMYPCSGDPQISLSLTLFDLKIKIKKPCLSPKARKRRTSFLL